MSPEKQRIAIAEHLGWTDIQYGDAFGTIIGFAPCMQRRDPWMNRDSYFELPNYLNDLNAMHEAEKVLLKGHEDDPEGCELWSDYQTYLILACQAYLSYHATAAQRAKAFLRTIGKWEVNDES